MHEYVRSLRMIGNYDGLGAVRQRELMRSCAILGIPRSHVTILDDPQLQDGPVNIWPPEVISAVVRQHLLEHNTMRILTFDKQGVSGHPNHKAVSNGLRYMRAGYYDKDWPSNQRPHVYELVSKGFPRAYLSLLDVPITLACMLLSRCWCMLMVLHGCTATYDEISCCLTVRPWYAHLAVKEHRSQYIWYRRLYVLVSRYSFVNTFRKWNERMAHNSRSALRKKI